MNICRERRQYLKYGSIPKKWGWPDSPQPSSNPIYTDTPLRTANGIFPSQTNLHTFFINLLFSCLLWPPPLLPLTSSSSFDLLFFLWPPLLPLTSSSSFDLLFFLWPPLLPLTSSSSFDLLFFLWSPVLPLCSTSKSNALMTWPSSILNTWPYQRTLFAIASWCIVSFRPSMNIKSVELFLPLSCTPHIALTMDLSVLHKIPISGRNTSFIFSFIHSLYFQLSWWQCKLLTTIITIYIGYINNY